MRGVQIQITVTEAKDDSEDIKKMMNIYNITSTDNVNN